MAPTRLVIVDDDPIFRLDLQEVLQGLGYLVAGEAADAPSALTAARTTRPDLVIMDIDLAGAADGITAAATLTAEQIAPVLLLTGFGDSELVQRAMEAGVVGYLMKPISEAELRPAIEITLARFQEFQALAGEATDLREQLETRKLLERAKGLLMQQQHLSEAEAFRRIQQASMNTRKPMRAVAEAILLAGQIGA